MAETDGDHEEGMMVDFVTGRQHVTWDVARCARLRIEAARQAECERRLAHLHARTDRALCAAILAVTTVAAVALMVVP
jgi:hypothetical protein